LSGGVGRQRVVSGGDVGKRIKVVTIFFLKTKNESQKIQPTNFSHTQEKKKKNGKKPCSKKKKECEGNNDETQGE
jgi:hypothetical protein